MNNAVEALFEKMKWVALIAVRRRWLALSVTAVAAASSAVVIDGVPNRYEAMARVYVDTQSVLKPLMAGVMFQPDIDQQVRMLARTLISRPNLERLVRIPELQLDVSSSSARDEVVSRLMDQIKVVPTATGNLYEISYRGASPESAKQLVEATVNMFVHSGADAKKRDTVDAGRFIEDQIRSYEAKLVEAESRLKDFKSRNLGVSGISTQDYFARISALTEGVNKLRVELSAAEQSRDSYRRELAIEESTGGMGLSDSQERLEAQKKNLNELLRRYTDVHPDVISTRRLIAEMEMEVRRKGAGGRGTASVARSSTSPALRAMRISLSEAEARVVSLRAQLSDQQSELEQVKAVAARAPQVEAELAQMNRDYEVIRKNHELMVARRESASLGAKLDASSQLAEFRLIEPPRVSKAPAFPSRVHLGLVATVAALIAGVLAALLADHLRPTIENATALQTLTRRPLLGSVSVMLSPQALIERRTDLIRFAIAAAIVLAMQGVWLAWIAIHPMAE